MTRQSTLTVIEHQRVDRAPAGALRPSATFALAASLDVRCSPTRSTHMGKHIKLTASDGFTLGAYRADPTGPSKGGVVVIQEIFGVNHHIRAICDRLAENGFSAVAPALFDRIEPGFEAGYSPDEIASCMRFIQNPDFAAFL